MLLNVRHFSRVRCLRKVVKISESVNIPQRKWLLAAEVSREGRKCKDEIGWRKNTEKLENNKNNFLCFIDFHPCFSTEHHPWKNYYAVRLRTRIRRGLSGSMTISPIFKSWWTSVNRNYGNFLKFSVHLRRIRVVSRAVAECNNGIMNKSLGGKLRKLNSDQLNDYDHLGPFKNLHSYSLG